MGWTNRDGLKAGLLVGMIALVVLFVGQTLSFTVRWLSGAISGGILILLAIGIGYATYELSTGWTAAEDGTESTLDRSQQETELKGSNEQTHRDDPVSEQEIDDELEELIEDTRGTNNNPAREVE
jgi:hypothetical protein